MALIIDRSCMSSDMESISNLPDLLGGFIEFEGADEVHHWSCSKGSICCLGEVFFAILYQCLEDSLSFD
jgi:hypothetical protein